MIKSAAQTKAEDREASRSRMLWVIGCRWVSEAYGGSNKRPRVYHSNGRRARWGEGDAVERYQEKRQILEKKFKVTVTAGVCTYEACVLSLAPALFSAFLSGASHAKHETAA
jgi:hypothetical protein